MYNRALLSRSLHSGHYLMCCLISRKRNKNCLNYMTVSSSSSIAFFILFYGCLRGLLLKMWNMIGGGGGGGGWWGIPLYHIWLWFLRLLAFLPSHIVKHYSVCQACLCGLMGFSPFSSCPSFNLSNCFLDACDVNIESSLPHIECQSPQLTS